MNIASNISKIELCRNNTFCKLGKNMLKNYRVHIIIGALGFGLLIALIIVSNVISASTTPEPLSLDQEYQPFNQTAKPVEGWYICVDLGVGPVPGRVNPRQRFILCHPDNWEVKAYCLNPNLPNPPLGTGCSRISEDTYWCGPSVQPVKEYIEPPPPTPAFTPTFTPTPTPTPTMTPTPTATPTQRPDSGGPSYSDILSDRVFPIQPTPTGGISGAYHPSNSGTGQGEASGLGLPGADFYGIDFNNSNEWIKIKIIPADKRVNNGKPILINFIPGLHCEFGSNTACVNTYTFGENGSTIFLTIHSGVGGEAQTYRHAMEGTAFDQAAYQVKEIIKNVNAISGAQVIIYQGETTIHGLTLGGSARVPPAYVRQYFELPVMDAFGLAAEINSSLQPYLNSSQPLIVFETCGWRVAGEKSAPGLGSTRSAVYIGVIQKTP